MPLIDDPSGFGFVDSPALPVPENMPEPQIGEDIVTVGTPDFRSVLEAEIQTNNSVGSLVADESGPTSKFMLQPYDPEFDLGEALKGTGYENNPSLFVTARNKAHVDAIIDDLYREEKNREVIAHSTWGQYVPAMLAGQALDPINWLSLGTVGLVRVAGQAALRSTASRAAIIGTGVALDTAAQEAVLQSTQRTRTAEESVINIGGSLLLGGLIGGVGARMLLRSEREAIERAIERDLSGTPEPRLDDFPVPRPGAKSAGAAAVDVAAETAAPTVKGAFGADILSSRMGPMQRTMRSSIDETRRAANELAESPYIFRENEAGQITAPRGDAMQRPGTVQTRLGSVWESRMMPPIYAMRDLYLEYRGVHARSFAERAKLGLNDLAGRRGEALSEVEFREAVTDALNNGDAHEIPEVAKAAGLIRENFLKFVDEDGKASGVIKDDKDVIPRAYLGPKIIAERLRFRDIVFKHLKRRQSEQITELDQINAQRAQRAAEDAALSEEVFAQRDLAQARDQAARDAERAQPARYEGLPLTNEEIDTIVDFWKYVRDMEARPKPESLAAFVVRSGGVEDPGGDVLSMIGRHRDRPGLVRKGPENEGGGFIGGSADRANTLDDMALRAWERGFFPDHTERPTINEFLDALGDDLATGNVVRGEDMGYFDDLAVAEEMAQELADYGITVRQFRKENRLREFFGQKASRTADEDAGALGQSAGAKTAGDAEPAISKAEEKLRLRANMEDGELLELADTITSRLHTRIEGRTAHDAHLIRDEDGFIREDALLDKEDFALPYNEVRDFVQRDVELLMRMMHRSMIPDIEIALRFGSSDMADAFKAIQSEAAERMNATADPKERAKINKQAERDVRDLAAMRDRLNGRYALPDDPTSIAVRAGRFTRDATTVTKMGASVLASVPETARIITARGISAVFSDLMYPALKNWNEFVRVSADARIATHALDHHTAARAMAIADGAEDWGNLPKVDRFSREATKTFMRFTGLPKLTDWQKTMSGVLSMKSILEASEALAGGTATTRQITLLSRLGISKDNAAKIADQFKKHGSKSDRLWAPEVGKWDADARAASEAFLGGVRSEVNRLITTPGLETPNMAQGELGRIIFQFKSFIIASYERVLVSGLQHNDVPFWSTVVVQIALAFMVNEARKALFEPTSGKRQKTFDERWNDPAERNQMFMDAVDRAGVLGWLGEVNSTMDRAFSSGLSTALGTGGEKARGLSSSSELIRQFAGPAAAQAADTTLFGVKLAQKLSGQRHWTEADTRQMERVIPFIGLPYLRMGLEALGAEQAINRQMGATNQ